MKIFIAVAASLAIAGFTAAAVAQVVETPFVPPVIVVPPPPPPPPPVEILPLPPIWTPDELRPAPAPIPPPILMPDKLRPAPVPIRLVPIIPR